MSIARFGYKAVPVPQNKCIRHTISMQLMLQNKPFITMWLFPFVVVSVSFPRVNLLITHPELRNTDFYKAGDLEIGAILPLQQRVAGHLCAAEVWPAAMQAVQAFMWAMDKINADPKLLPNITLGYAIQSDCRQESVALAKTIKFLPMDQSRIKRMNISTDLYQTLTHPLYDVVAVVGPYSSSMSVLTASLLGLFELPQISFTASAGELSDKERFPYFSRLVPPNQYMAFAIASMVSHFNWTYISTLNTDDSFGAAVMRNVRRAFKAKGICTAYSRAVEMDATAADFDDIVRILKSKKARVVVAVLIDIHSISLMNSLAKADLLGEFVVIGGEAFRLGLAEPSEFYLNTVIIDSSHDRVPGFEPFFLQQSLWWNDTGSIWYGSYQPKHLGCSWSVPKGDENSCAQYTNYTDIPAFYFNLFPPAVVDSARVFAYALHNLIEDHCPLSRTPKSKLRNCVKGPLLLEYVRKTKFTGYNFEVEFDENGDVFGHYSISQGVKSAGGGYEILPVGTWSRKLNVLKIDESLMQWYTRNGVGELVARHDVPESVCAKPCPVGHFYIQGELVCCWECRKCWSNERLRGDLHGCVPCPMFQWPDQRNFTTCQSIPPTSLQWESPIGISLSVIATAGILVTLAITVLFIRHGSRKVIKASSRELMAPIIFGLFLACSTVFLYISNRTDVTCYASYVGFNLSCTCIFGPLFLKMLRIYRIFRAAERCEKVGRLSSATWQLVFFILIILIQVCHYVHVYNSVVIHRR